MIYFTSDWHFGDRREVGGINLLLRPDLSTNFKVRREIARLPDGCTLYNLGDVCLGDVSDLEMVAAALREKNIRHILIKGNYDRARPDVERLFDYVYDEFVLDHGQNRFYLNHYPVDCREVLRAMPECFGLTGHIHGLWKVKQDMINVGLDVWHFRFPSIDEILFLKNGIENFDKNVFL